MLIAGFTAGAVWAARRRPRRYAIAERSMSPALEPGDYTLAVIPSRVRRGDVVVFEQPEGSGFEVTKRVVGLAGERVELVAGWVHIDGQKLAEPWATGPTTGNGAWQLGNGEVFVLGDARAVSSSDSRSIGPLARARCRHRIALRYWPPGRLGPV